MKIIISFILMMLSITVCAQQNSLQSAANLLAAKSDQQINAKNTADGFTGKTDTWGSATVEEISPISVQVLFGTQGVGADLKYGFLPYLSGRAGFGLIPITANNMFGFSSFSSSDQLSAKFSNIHLLADY